MNDSSLSVVVLNERSREIFRTIVESYLRTGEPMGSRNLSRILTTTLSPASIRNVMADLEDSGLIYAPHTSAGRMPTEQGLRLFVDAMLEVGNLNSSEREHIAAELAGGARQSLESVLDEASRALSGLSHGAGLVLSSKSDLRLKHIEFVQIEARKLLVVLVGEDGSVENRIADMPSGLPLSALVEASNYANKVLAGKTINEALVLLRRLRNAREAELDKLTQRAIEAGLATWAGAEEGRPQQLIIRGRANLLDDVSALEDLERIRLLFDDLESKRSLMQLLDLAEAGEGVRLFIGSENKLFSLSGSSLIVAPYTDKKRNVVGVLGVIGPTRINYGRIIPLVDYTAKVVSELIR